MFGGLAFLVGGGAPVSCDWGGLTVRVDSAEARRIAVARKRRRCAAGSAPALLGELGATVGGG
jgi:hypothetical protein